MGLSESRRRGLVGRVSKRESMTLSERWTAAVSMVKGIDWRRGGIQDISQ